MENTTADLLQRSKSEILEYWLLNQDIDANLDENSLTNEALRQQCDELLTAFLKAIRKGNYSNIEATEYTEVLELLGGISMSRAQMGFTSKETGKFVFSLKEALIHVITSNKTSNLEALVADIITISKLLDSLGIVTFETFIKGREEVILRQTQEINEISTPVIRVWDGILALPIIGTLDSARTQIVMENLLHEIVNTGSSFAILDISGVPAVDSLVAQHLIKTVNATRLMGAECIISGIRSEIAQTIVHLGIDLTGIQTKASLAAALKFAFQNLNLEIKKNESKPRLR